MERKTNLNGRKAGSMREIKWMIVSMSLTLVLALWSIFSRYSGQNFASAASNVTAPKQQAADIFQLLPPIPTLIPSLNNDQLAAEPASLSQSPALKPGKIIIGSRLPQTLSRPVARTRSSR
jgi:hypothetical protein